jgi:malonyl-CoA O-methyltransferase
MAEEDAASAVDAPFARRAFGRASASYDAAAVLQGEVRNLLLERLELTELEPRIVLDAST